MGVFSVTWEVTPRGRWGNLSANSLNYNLNGRDDAELSRMFMRAVLAIAMGALMFGMFGCASDDTGSTTTTSNSEPVAGAAPGGGIEPSIHGTSPGVKW